MQPNCLKGRVVCGTVYGDTHLNYLLGSFTRVGYSIPVPDFYLGLHGCRKITLQWSNQSLINLGIGEDDKQNYIKDIGKSQLLIGYLGFRTETTTAGRPAHLFRMKTCFSAFLLSHFVL